MPIEVRLTLRCDRCDDTCDATTLLGGRKLDRLRVDMSEATLPPGWWVGRRGDGRHAVRSEMSCGCPEHAGALRGY